MGLAALAAMAAITVVVLLASRGIKVFVLSCVAFLPLTLGDFHGIPSLLVAEWLVPALAPFVAFEMARSNRPVLVRRSAWLFVALSALVLVALVDFLRFSSVAQHDIRGYFDVLVAVLLVVELSWYAIDLVNDEERVARYLGALVVISLVLTYARLVGFYGSVPLPLLGVGFRYGRIAPTPTEDIAAARIGGIYEASSFGLCALAALWYARPPRLIVGVLLSAFLFAALVSGGRTYMLAFVCGAIVFVGIVAAPRWRGTYVVAAAIVSGAAVAAVAALGLTVELRRILSVQGGIARQSPERYATIQALWHQFTLHPLLGKGLGTAASGVSNPLVSQQVSEFVSQQVTYGGGHSSWFSALALFGVVGGAVLAVLTVGVAAASVRKLLADRTAGWTSPAAHHILVFVLLMLVIRAVMYVSNGNGYSDLGLYAVVGLYAATLNSSRG